jgi:enoyl-CoA hydratase
MEKPSFTHFTLEEKDGVAIFTIQRPEVMNALNKATWTDIYNFAKYLDENEDLRVGIITGSGDKAFIAGADINNVAQMQPLEALYRDVITLQSGLELIEKNRKPVIAAINGYALGGGLELALACDIRIMSDNATVGLPECGLGVIPGAGGTQRLARICGIGIAKQLVLTGYSMNAEEAVRCNLAMKAVPQDQLMDEAMKVARWIIKKAPLAVALAKRAINEGINADLNTAMYLEKLSFGMLLGTEDKHEGTAAFIEKRKPEFHGK